MSFSFSINSKPQPNRVKKSPLASQSAQISKNFVSEFVAGESPPPPESTIKPIAPIPNNWHPTKKLKNLPNLSQLSQSNGADPALQFQLDPGSNPDDPSYNSMGYGLNLRQPSTTVNTVPIRERGESIADSELRKLKEDLEKLPDDTGMDDFADVPVEGFGAALLSGYGWKQGRGIGRNAKEDVKIFEFTKKAGRGGLGFTGEFPENRIDIIGEHLEKKGFSVGKEVRIVEGRGMGLKGKIVEVRSDGDLLVLKISSSNEKVIVRIRDVAEVGSADEDKCLRKLKDLEIKEKDGIKDKGVNWLRDHIRVRIISEKLKGGRLYLKTGVVVDVVGPGMCDISIDESRELIQGVEQELLETALPKCGGPVLVLHGRYKGVYGCLLEQDSKKETALVRDADTHELLNVRLEQIAEYKGDPSDIGY